MEHALHEIGKRVEAAAPSLCDTPMPVIDLDVAEQNIARLQQACDAAGVRNRPHIKTHKSIELARLQIRAGAAGITCQKLGEAEIMADAGIDDILISYNILGRAKHERLARLNERVTLTVSCDNGTVAAGLSEAVSSSSKPLPVLVECDTGRHRCGVTSPQAAAELAARIDSFPGLVFAGLMLYPPNGECAEAAVFVERTRQECAARDLSVETVSAGGTPNMAQVGRSGETEYRAGTYIFNDRQMIGCGAATLDDCALFIHATVVSHPEPDRIMLDAGSKSLTGEPGGFEDYGLLVDFPGSRLYRLAEEHGFVDISGCDRIPAIGDVVRVLPNHVCPVVNLFDDVILARAGGDARLLHIDARGRVR